MLMSRPEIFYDNIFQRYFLKTVKKLQIIMINDAKVISITLTLKPSVEPLVRSMHEKGNVFLAWKRIVNTQDKKKFEKQVVLLQFQQKWGNIFDWICDWHHLKSIHKLSCSLVVLDLSGILVVVGLEVRLALWSTVFKAFSVDDFMNINRRRACLETVNHTLDGSCLLLSRNKGHESHEKKTEEELHFEVSLRMFKVIPLKRRWIKIIWWLEVKMNEFLYLFAI